MLCYLNLTYVNSLIAFYFDSFVYLEKSIFFYSKELGCRMKFGVFIPPQAESGKYEHIILQSFIMLQQQPYSLHSSILYQTQIF